MMRPGSEPTAKKKRGRCIFCGGTPLSKEHIWPHWLRKHFAFDQPYNMHIGTVGALAPDGKIIWGIRHDQPRTGDFRSQKLRVVCRRCNNGWMSRLQMASKPILLPFISGSWEELDARQQGIITAWVTMLAMVWELRHPPTMATSADQRSHLRQTGEPPPGWKIWIGRTANIWECAINHIGWLQYDSEKPPTVITLSANTQITACCLGNLYLLVYGSTSEITYEEEKDFAAKHGTEVLWPLQDRRLLRPTRAIGDADVNGIIRDFLPVQLEQKFFLDIHRRTAPSVQPPGTPSAQRPVAPSVLRPVGPLLLRPVAPWLGRVPRKPR